MDFGSNFGSILLYTLWFFAFFAFIWLLIVVFGDLFGDRHLSGWAKFFWFIFVAFLPFLGILVYLIARGGGMAQRQAEKVHAMKQQQDSYIRSVAGTQSAADQIASAKALLDSGSISQAEFEALKAKALAS